MNQKLGDICSVRLVRRRVEIQLNRARHLVVYLSHQYNSCVASQPGCDLFSPKAPSLIQVEWKNETDVGAVMNASMKNFGDGVQMLREPIFIEPEDLDASDLVWESETGSWVSRSSDDQEVSGRTPMEYSE